MNIKEKVRAQFKLNCSYEMLPVEGKFFTAQRNKNGRGVRWGSSGESEKKTSEKKSCPLRLMNIGLFFLSRFLKENEMNERREEEEEKRQEKSRNKT